MSDQYTNKGQFPPLNQPQFDEHISVEETKKLVYGLLHETNNPRDNQWRIKGKYADIRGLYVKKYESLLMRYPALFNMIIENGTKFDLKKFEETMNMVSKVRKNEVTLEKASEDYGQKRYDEYVKPKLE